MQTVRRADIETDGAQQITVRYLTPHSKWSIRWNIRTNLFMLSLSRGWSDRVDESCKDAAAIDVSDNDWI